MRPSTPWRAWAQRVFGFGPSRIALALAMLFVLVSLALPYWSLGVMIGPDQDVSSFSSSTVITDRYRGGSWDGTEILPYTSTQFTFRQVAGVLGTAYLLVVALFIVFAVVLALFSTDYGQLMPTLSLLIVSLIVLGVSLLALFYPIAAIPAAATTDVRTFTIGGFWGSAREPLQDWSWGPALGWWLLLIAVILGTLGSVVPYLKSVRALVPAAAKPSRPSA